MLFCIKDATKEASQSPGKLYSDVGICSVLKPLYSHPLLLTSDSIIHRAEKLLAFISLGQSLFVCDPSPSFPYFLFSLPLHLLPQLFSLFSPHLIFFDVFFFYHANTGCHLP